MTYVYMLWRHGEDGPTDTAVTLDRHHVVSLASCYAEVDWETLQGLLERTDAELAARSEDADSDGHRLSDGWGGVHLQVCKVEKFA